MAGSANDDATFHALLAKVSERLESGEKVDPTDFADEYPIHVERLRKLLPTLVAMADLGHADSDPTLAAPTEKRQTGEALRELGDFRIVREIARGGMGVVYEAEQVSLNRRVALKVLPFAAVLDQRQLDRFRREAEAAGAVHHQNIVPVYSVGCERGVHFYAMQFINGHTLGELIGQLREASGFGPTGRPASTKTARKAPPHPPRADATTLTLPEMATTASTTQPAFFRSVAHLGIQVAEALDHAHQQGVVHRDIKPSNLMVDAEGKPWITDFGLARIETAPSLTVSGDLLGTLRYMSPEQALAKRIVIDHRSDIYSLGVTLYELLTLRPVFGGTDRRELLRQIAFEEPRPPRKLNRAIPADLETILLKAMAKNPAERYATAQDLADDLGRFLDLKPIKARRPTVLQRAAKWARRHTGAVAAAGIILVIGVIALAVSTALIAAAREDEAEQRQAAQHALWKEQETSDKLTDALGKLKVEKARADEQRQDALGAKAQADRKAAEAKAVSNFLVKDLLASARPERTLGREVTVKEVLANAERKIDASLGNHPLREAAVRNTMGWTYRTLGQFADAEGHLRRAVETRTDRLGPEDPDTLTSMHNLATVLTDLGKLKEARKLHEQTLAARMGGPEHHGTLGSMNGLAIVLSELDELDKARKLFEETLVLSTRVRGAEHADTLDLKHNLANVHWKQGELEEARRLHKETLDARRRVLGAESLDTLHSMADLAMVLRDLGKWDEARKLHEQALAAYERVLGPEHASTLLSKNNLAVVLTDLGELEEARKLLEPTVAARKRVLGPEHEHTLTSMNNLALVLWRQEKLEEARTLFRETLELATRARALGPEHHCTLRAAHNLAAVLDELGEREEARKLFEQTLAIKERVLGHEHAETRSSRDSLAIVLAKMAYTLYEQGKRDEAWKLYEEALTVQKPVLGPEDRDVLSPMGSLAIRLLNEEKVAEAHRLNEQVLAVRRRVLGAEHPATLIALHELAVTLERQDRLEEARKLNEHVLAVRRRVLGVGHRFTLLSMHNLANVLEAEDKPDEARKLYEEAIAIHKRVPGPKDPNTLILLMSSLASMLEAQDKLEDARKLHEEALAIRKRGPGPLDPVTLCSTGSLARLLSKQGKWGEVRKLLEDTLAAHKRIDGAGHPSTLRCRCGHSLEVILASLCSRAAWSLCIDVGSSRADRERAVAFAKRAVELRPDVANDWSNLGVAQYRAGNFTDAVAALERAARQKGDGDLYHKCFLAMAYWRLGRRDQARQSYDRCVEWMAKRPAAKNAELRRFRAEAAALLGITEAPPAPEKRGEPTKGKE